ncbi:MAG: ABC transporter ATP-binding protein [Phycisphaerae bacterium]|nr:ABC transporter ATP-binding protein [Phycisphaerae bacterium]
MRPLPSADPVNLSMTVENISFGYGDQPVLRQVNAEFPPGQVTAVLGPNGSGKSTLMQILLGFLQPQAGVVRLGERLLTQVSERQRATQIAFVPQAPTVGFSYTVEEIILMGRWPRRGADGPLHAALGLTGADDRAAATQAMWNLNVHHLAGRAFGELSGGEQQRVTIARAIALDAPILLLDEVTTSLDLWHQLEFLAYLAELAHRRGRCVVWITHDLNQANEYADRVVLMNDGQVVAQDAVKSVLVPDILETVYRVKVDPAGKALRFLRKSPA